MLDNYPTNGLSRRAKLPILTTLLGSKDSHFRNSNKFLLVYFQLQREFSQSPSPHPSFLCLLSAYSLLYIGPVKGRSLSSWPHIYWKIEPTYIKIPHLANRGAASSSECGEPQDAPIRYGYRLAKILRKSCFTSIGTWGWWSSSALSVVMLMTVSPARYLVNELPGFGNDVTRLW